MLIAAGEKDEIGLNWCAVALMRQRGGWWYALPEQTQARKAIWNQVNPHTGKRRIDEAFPKEIRKRTLEAEMFIEFINGSTWQVIGSDNYDHLVGASPLGITFSEWAIAMPAAWAYFAPILEENNGTALFITTPRGKNHAYKTLQAGMSDPQNWFAQISSVVETGYPLDRVEKQRREYQQIFGEDAGDAMIEQEYFCSFEAAVLGSIYGREIAALRRLGRVRHFAIDPTYPVHRSWDFGISKSDAMSIWFFQWIGGEVRYVDYLEGFQQPISWYADHIHAKGYPRGTKDDPAIDHVPHDARVKSLQTGTTRVQFMQECRLNPILVPDHYVEDRHSAARHVLRRAWFHPRCADALETLAAYQYEYDEKAMTFRKVAKHNYACFTGDVVIPTEAGTYPIKSIPDTGRVMTPWGWKPYQNLGMTRANAQLVEVCFKDGLTVRCTPDHLFFTDKGWRSASALRMGSKIQSLSITGFNTLTEGCLGFTPESTIFPVTMGDEDREQSDSISRFGKRLLARFLGGAIFIIEILTNGIIASKTSNAWCLKSMTHCQAMGCADLAVSDPLQKKEQQLGTSLRKATHGMLKMLNAVRIGLRQSGQKCHAMNAEIYSWELPEKGKSKSTVQQSAKERYHLEYKEIKSVRMLPYLEDVYDISVDDVHCFPLANGAIVHNSHNADSFGISSVAYKEPSMVKLPGAKGRATLIHAPEIGDYQSDRAQVTLDDLWRKHKEDLNKARRGR